MRKLAESIRDDADKLTKEVRKGGNALDLLLRKAKLTLKALDVELTEAEAAKSLVQARAAIEEQGPTDGAMRKTA